MIDYVKYIYFYNSLLIKIVRLLIWLGLIALTVNIFVSGELPRYPLFFLSLLFMQEVFFYGKINAVRPLQSLTANPKSLYDCMTKQALLSVIGTNKTEDVIKRLLHFPQIKFILQKSGVTKKDMQLLPIDKDVLLQKAAEVANEVESTTLMSMDMIVAYLLLTEDQTKLLFTKELKEKDLFNILVWARLAFPFKEKPTERRITFTEEGIGEGLTTGWTIETQKYTTNFTQKAIEQKPFVVDRIVEYKEMVEALLDRGKDNVLLVGERGIGKEMLVRLLAYSSYSGELPGRLSHDRIYQLMLGMLLAGATTQSELQTRLESVFVEISHAGNVMLYIPEFQDMLGASSFGVDLSGSLFPYLKNGQLPIIASITPGGYKSFIEGKPIEEVLHVIHLQEPETATALQMLFASAQWIEQKNSISFDYKAVKEALHIASRYQQDRYLPGSAASLLSDTANSVAIAGKKSVTGTDVVEQVEKKTSTKIAAPTGEEKDLLLHLEDKLHERVVDQVEGIHAISEALRRLRTGLSSQTKPISFLFLGPTGVGKTETAKALAALYFHGEGNMIRLDMSEYADANGLTRLLGAAPGQGDERGELTDKIHDHPSSLVLLDEFEKASPQILDLFLQVFDDGRLTDSKGRTVSFANAIIIATSNAGSEFIREEVGKGTPVDKAFQQRLLEKLQSEHVFKPELLNRFDEVVTFKPLGEKEVAQIIKLMLIGVAKTLAEKDITISFDEKILEKIAKDGVDQQFGARPLARFIQDNIEDLVAKKLLTNEVQRGNHVLFTANDAGEVETIIS